MHRLVMIATVTALAAGAVACSSPRPAGEVPHQWTGDAIAEQVRQQGIAAVAELDTTLQRVVALARDTDLTSPPLDSIRLEFTRARAQWKRVEWLVEAYTPTAAKQLNGPPLPEVEYAEGHHPVRPPEGFQVVEALLWPGPAERTSLVGEVSTMRQSLERVRQILTANVLLDGIVWDAGRQQLARIATLGLGGFDSPAAQQQLVEARHALTGMQRAVNHYADFAARRSPQQWSTLQRAFAHADSLLRRDDDPTTADYWQLLTEGLLPLARQYAVVQRELKMAAPPERSVWRVDASTPFEQNALDVMFYAGPSAIPGDSVRIALGEALAFSTALSADGSRSCVTCHVPARAYTDGLSVRTALRGATSGTARNTPTLLNAALQPGLFADQRVAYLEDQVTDVVANPAELHGDLDDAAARLSRDPAIRQRFMHAFGTDGDSAVTSLRIRQAIAAWERSLVRLDSRFDRGVRGDTAALSPEERRGFAVFMGKGKCGSCHFAPLFGGTLPPGYQKAEFEVLGTPSRPQWRNARVDADPGRAGVTHMPLHAHAFKTPMLRNVAVTAPYMHNGVYRTLDEVVEFYARGGGHGIGAALEHQTLPPDRIEFTTAERRALVRFLETLTDTSGIRTAPQRPLPSSGGSRVAQRSLAPAPVAPATAVPIESRRPTSR
jgi:cytochrome c peroxidase